MTIKKRIYSYFKNIRDVAGYFYTNYKNKDENDCYGLYSNDDSAWTKNNKELMRVTDTGNGFSIIWNNGSFTSKEIERVELNYAAAEYLLILLLQERKHRGVTKFKEESL